MRKRLIVATVILLLFSGGIIGRLGYIALGTAYSVQEGFHSYSLLLDNVEPNIYDRNGIRMTNNVKEYCAILRPDEAVLSELSEVIPEANIADTVMQMQNAKPFLYYSAEQLTSTDNIPVFEVYTSHSSCEQLISRASSGLLSELDESIGSLKINYSVDANGRILAGDRGTVTETHYRSMEGLKLTLDSTVQDILYFACKDMKSGCALVMDTKTSSLLACVTKPDESYVNKIFSSYPVGSVFKTVVALCALENGLDPEYTCTDSITVGDTKYSCYQHKKHGKQHLKQALANSCNCYFVSLALTLGAERITDMAKRLGFNDVTTVYKDLKVRNASLPTDAELRSKGELSLLGFGQGKLMATPLQFGSLMCTVANEGIRQPVRIVKSEVAVNGMETPVEYEEGKRVTDVESATNLLAYLRYVVSDGSAGSADYKSLSAGKTATAQTGSYRNGEELLTTWFTGLYPYDEPQYAIVIVCEEGTGGAADCCPIFRTVVEMLDAL